MQNRATAASPRWDDRTLVRVQAASGLVFALFTGIHLLNTALAALGGGVYDAFQRAVRPLYQFPLVEIGLIFAPLIVHIGAGVARMWRRRGRGAKPSLRVRLHRWSGLFLLVVIFEHVGAVRGPSLFADVFPEFAGITFALAWMPAFFYPYFALLALTGLYHGLYGTAAALGVFGVRVPATLRAGRGLWIAAAAGSLVLLVALAGFAGALYPIGDPMDNDYARLVLRLVGIGAE